MTVSKLRNFRAFLRYRSNRGDSMPKISNLYKQIICMVGDAIQKPIAQFIIGGGGYFSSSDSDVRDASNREKLAIALCFLDETGKISSILSVVTLLTIAMI